MDSKNIKKNNQKLFVIMGKSGSGKDTIYKNIVNKTNLLPVIPYTTRPIRENEKEGVDYNFVSHEERDKLIKDGKVLEIRNYDTVFGVWSYFTVKDSSWEKNNNQILIGTLDTFINLKRNCTDREIIPIYIEVEDGERLYRLIKRERSEKNPKYKEMCRRFIADSSDFSEEKLISCGINKRFINETFDTTVEEIIKFINRIK